MRTVDRPRSKTRRPVLGSRAFNNSPRATVDAASNAMVVEYMSLRVSVRPHSELAEQELPCVVAAFANHPSIVGCFTENVWLIAYTSEFSSSEKRNEKSAGLDTGRRKMRNPSNVIAPCSAARVSALAAGFSTLYQVPASPSNAGNTGMVSVPSRSVDTPADAVVVPSGLHTKIRPPVPVAPRKGRSKVRLTLVVPSEPSRATLYMDE
mmetsp:Transcript_11741/g.37508  ORF Transcript_11741/g.37508 Transcript_11741/m.37508 type:complete len:208 (+) Transcript_11741:6567-7190(+)